jgi:DNA repair protein SbcC/Rad50
VKPFLKSISLTDFRSVRGTVSIPLDASIVLIHGQNGTGKTSLLSGIELALTGRIPSLYRFDEDYLTHLVHKEAKEGRVELTIDLEDIPQNSSQMKIQRAVLMGKPLLTAEQASFFSERCYLAQAAMSRLLELYQGKESKKGDSALTKFVKDLLGLGQLDALINGLHDAGHTTRLKNALPLYRRAVDRLPELSRQLESSRADLRALQQEQEQTETLLTTHLRILGLTYSPELSHDQMQTIAGEQKDRQELQRITRVRRNLLAAKEQWQDLQGLSGSHLLSDAESASFKANGELEKWRNNEGAQIRNLFGRLKALFVDLPDPDLVGPEKARAEALRAVTKELRRCDDLLKRDSETTARLRDIDGGLQRAAARLQILDQQVASHLQTAGQLAQVLTTLLPHLTGEECPVCGRDFSEISERSLHSHVSERVATLVESAGRLQSFIRERTEAFRLQAEGQREREGIVVNELDPEERNALTRRKADLEETESKLNELQASTSAGQQLIVTANAASRRLADIRSKNEQAIGFRFGLQEFESALALLPTPETESIEAALDRFYSIVSEEEKRLTARQEARSGLAIAVQERSRQLARRRALGTTIATSELELKALTTGLEAFENKMKQARELSRVARNVRTEIVRRVFNDSLNALWKELFIRLAPSESFVPAFALPEKDGGIVEAALETRYRSGGKGGNPRVMLSAGNLNTAALTLFLALHLSVEPKLPCLIVDDPVQSMDEVHIAQFAALLRTLSRQHDRQIVIAVHEKPLFDYLALELAPAYPGDRLISVELEKTSDGRTFAHHDVITFSPDNAVVAA